MKIETSPVRIFALVAIGLTTLGLLYPATRNLDFMEAAVLGLLSSVPVLVANVRFGLVRFAD